jgi:phospholipase/carboxylesterase
VPNDGRLRARPGGRPARDAAPGTHRLRLDPRRDATLQVPADVREPAPLLVLLHGAGGDGDGILGYLGEAAEKAGVAVVAPDARASTWDAIRDDFGPDVAFLDLALARVFERIDVDPARLAVGGFSDGATYAVSLGLINGDLFSRVLAFSPGFVIPGIATGRPRVFVSHGRSDGVLPVGRCSRVIVPRLRAGGHEVTYREFDGGHEVPPAIAAEGMAWIAAR